jgi:hypothetical protein
MKKGVLDKAEPDHVAGDDHHDDQDNGDFPKTRSADPCRVLMPALVPGPPADAADRRGRVVLGTHGKRVEICRFESCEIFQEKENGDYFRDPLFC